MSDNLYADWLNETAKKLPESPDGDFATALLLSRVSPGMSDIELLNGVSVAVNNSATNLQMRSGLVKCARNELLPAWVRLLIAIMVDETELTQKLAKHTATLAKVLDSPDAKRVGSAPAPALSAVRALRLAGTGKIRFTDPFIPAQEVHTVLTDLSRTSWWAPSSHAELLANSVSFISVSLQNSCEIVDGIEDRLVRAFLYMRALSSYSPEQVDRYAVKVFPKVANTLGQLTEGSSVAEASDLLDKLAINAPSVSQEQLNTLAAKIVSAGSVISYSEVNVGNHPVSTAALLLRVIGTDKQLNSSLVQALAAHDVTSSRLAKWLRWSSKDKELTVQALLAMTERAGVRAAGIKEIVDFGFDIRDSESPLRKALTPSVFNQLRANLGEASWILSVPFIKAMSLEYGYSTRFKDVPSFVIDDLFAAPWNDDQSRRGASQVLTDSQWAAAHCMPVPSHEVYGKALAWFCTSSEATSSRITPPVGQMPLSSDEGYLSSELAHNVVYAANRGFSPFDGASEHAEHYAKWLHALSAGAFSNFLDECSSLIRNSKAPMPLAAQLVLNEALATAEVPVAQRLLLQAFTADYGSGLRLPYTVTLTQFARQLKHAVARIA